MNSSRRSSSGVWFAAQLAPSTALTNSPLDPSRINRRQVFFPVESPVAVGEGDRVELGMQIKRGSLTDLERLEINSHVVHTYNFLREIPWKVAVHPAAGSPVEFSHSTLRGMLIDPADVRMTDPACRPALTDRGVARRSVLELCDGARSLGQIEAEVFARHPGLFGSAAEAAVFVGEVVTRYTHDAT